MLEVKNTYKRTVNYQDAIILSGETESNLVDLGGMILLSILTPSNFTESDLTFNVSIQGDDATLYGKNIWDGTNGGPLALITATPSQEYNGYAHWFCTNGYVQIVSSNPQAEDTIIKLALQPLWQGIHG